MIHRLFTVYLFLLVAGLAATDYGNITTLTGPCVEELVAVMKTGDIKKARDKALMLSRTQAAKTCPEIWLVYAYCEMLLDGPESMAVSKEAVKRLPDSAPANLLYALNLLKECGSGGIIRLFRSIGKVRQAMERVVELDPDCNLARSTLINLYSLPKLLGGDETKLKHHLAELDRRDPYLAALAHGEIESAKENFAAAASHYRVAQKLQPEKSDALKRIIKLNAAMGDYNEAFREHLNLKEAFPGDGAQDDIYIELSAKSGLHTDEALAASKRYLATAKSVVPVERAVVLVNTAIILKQLGRSEESAKLVAEAESLWEGSKKLFNETEKSVRNKRPVVATR